MDWKAVGKKVVQAGAPILGGLLGGPVGATAGGLVASLFGTGDDPEQVLQAIQGDPEAALKLRQFELEHRVELEKLRIEAMRLQLQDQADARATELATDKAYLGDVAGARDRDIKNVQATGSRDQFMYLLAGLVVVGFTILCVVLMRWPLPEGSGNAVMMLFGALSTGFGTVLNFFFGSSKSSSDKTRLLTEKGR